MKNVVVFDQVVPGYLSIARPVPAGSDPGLVEVADFIVGNEIGITAGNQDSGSALKDTASASHKVVGDKVFARKLPRI